MNSNLLGSNLDQNMRDVFAVSFELYKIARRNNNLYRLDENKEIPRQLIELYFLEVKPDYNSMLYNFRKKYISGEAKVEKNDTKLEKQGVGLMYDFIQKFNPEKDNFNIFITGMQLHQLLYKPLDDKNKGDIKDKYDNAYAMLNMAKKEKNLEKYNEAKKVLEELSITRESFGGKLRDREVTLKDVDVKVPNSIDAKEFFNSFLNKEKIIKYQTMLSSVRLSTYIDYCVNTIAELIKYQPFNDGNKRTFRGLLNLMFKNRNLPPVYITTHEKKEYKDALIKAITKNDYTDLDYFYYYKICDSIYELDIKPYLENKDRLTDGIKEVGRAIDNINKRI